MPLKRRILAYGGTHMYTAEASITVTCPNCRWTATGPDLQALKEAKEHHATYQCPDDSALAEDQKILE